MSLRVSGAQFLMGLNSMPFILFAVLLRLYLAKISIRYLDFSKDLLISFYSLFLLKSISYFYILLLTGGSRICIPSKCLKTKQFFFSAYVILSVSFNILSGNPLNQTYVFVVFYFQH